MRIKSLTSCIVTVFLLVLTGYSFGDGASIPELKKVENPQDIPGLIDKVKGRIGQDFKLDGLRNDPKTLEEGFNYLVTESHADLIRETLNQWSTVYGADFSVEHQNETLRVFVFAGKPDFSGAFVYAVSQMGWRWPVFLAGRK